jgi:hypothetical protein
VVLNRCRFTWSSSTQWTTPAVLRSSTTWPRAGRPAERRLRPAPGGGSREGQTSFRPRSRQTTWC